MIKIVCNFHQRQFKKLSFSDKWKIEKNLGVEYATSSEEIKKLPFRDLRKIEKNQGVVFNDLG